MLLPQLMSAVPLLNTTSPILKKIIPLLLLILLLVSCHTGLSPENTVTSLLQYVAEDDFEGLSVMAPFLLELDREQQEAVRRALVPFTEGEPEMALRYTGFRRCLVTLQTREKQSNSLILSLHQKRGQWVLSENISYTQSLDFIPAE